MNEKVSEALDSLRLASNSLLRVREAVVVLIKEVLAPLKGAKCPIGSKDYADDIFYVYAEPNPNQFRRVTGIRYDYINDHIEVEYENNGRTIWETFENAHVEDILFLLDEIKSNIEYCDGYRGEGDDDEEEFAVPFLRTQWTDVKVKAKNAKEARQKAEAIFNQGHDEDVNWADVNRPEFDTIRGVQKS
jgi:hypothetical protein